MTKTAALLSSVAAAPCAHDWVKIWDKVEGVYTTTRICRLCRVKMETRNAPALQRPTEKLHIEKRFVADALDDFVIDEEKRTFEGYGCVYGVMDSYRCVWERGVFAKTLAEWRSAREWPSFYLQHDWDLIIGGYTDMYEDNKGLFVRGNFLDSMWGDHARALVREKRARGLSIGFVAIKERVEDADDWEKRVRYITEADLYEVSLVERPAVPGSGVTAIRADMSVRDVEKHLHSQGFSRDAAKSMASAWKSKGGQSRDATDPEDDEARDAPDAEAEAQAKAKAEAEQRAKQADAEINSELIRLMQGAGSALKSTTH